MCGHATLASAKALYDSQKVNNTNKLIKFHTQKSGTLTAQGNDDGTIRLEFPCLTVTQYNPTEKELDAIYKGFHLTSNDIIFIGKTIFDYFIEIKTESFLTLGYNQNFDIIFSLGGRGVILTCEGKKEINKNELNSNIKEIYSNNDFISRVFLPCVGINEDYVTGSAHCALCPYWNNKLLNNTYNVPLRGYQASKRGGNVHTNMYKKENGEIIIELIGKSFTTIISKLI